MEQIKNFAIIVNGVVTECVSIGWSEKQASDMGAIEYSNENIKPGWLYINNFFYPPMPSKHHLPINGEWVLDSEKLLNFKKNEFLKEIENLYDNILKNGAFPINITPDNKWFLPDNENFNIYKEYFLKEKKPLYIFVRYSNENRDQSFVANSLFSLNKGAILPISFTLDGVTCFDAKTTDNEILIDGSYLKLKSINKQLLDIIFNTITIKKQNDANYKDLLIKQVRKCNSLEELDNVKIIFRELDVSDEDTNIVGFNKVLLLNTLFRPLHNKTNLPMFYYNGEEKIYIDSLGE